MIARWVFLTFLSFVFYGGLAANDNGDACCTKVNCDCGCLYGNACSCGPESSQKAEFVCGKDSCDCGCGDGYPCSCGVKENEGCSKKQEFVCGKDSCDCGCGDGFSCTCSEKESKKTEFVCGKDSCDCGCGDGYPCSCGVKENEGCSKKQEFVCGKDSCDCGCGDGYPCSCGVKENEGCSKKQEFVCGKDSCDCGCGDGFSCTCGEKESKKAEGVCRKDNCDCGCGNGDPCKCDKGFACGKDNCDCGCDDGNACRCEPFQPALAYNPEYAFPDFQYECEEETDYEEGDAECCNLPCFYQYCVPNCCGCCQKWPTCERDRWWCSANCIYLGPYTYLCGDSCYSFGHCGLWGVWLPQEGPLYRPMIADPRQLTYSVGWRFNDDALTKNVIPVSFADNIAFIRWCNVWPWGGFLQINLEGGLWAVFDPLHESAPLYNADYYVGFPIEYAVDRWVFRLRAYHISSHLGDEFLLNNPGFDRRNPSAEYLDFFVSNYITDEIRLYSGIGWVIQHDESFDSGNFYVQAGTELRFPRLGFYNPCQHLYGLPFFAMDFKYFNIYKEHIDQTYVLGWEWGKTTCEFKRLRAYIMYHDGYSADGQFSEYADNWFSINLSYGY
ncbi:Conserved putative secreted protein [Criblamydia sequanensis CRIB-18]|uniref:Conserved putative secreted protein n=2 Tax=Candidatus Criblamydia sequanensis TaxID=340071 RepID=A0A090DZ96_9BACT|nr:Conserved putative secreted protein [Criblamydia sequanensis CRIB-18]